MKEEKQKHRVEEILSRLKDRFLFANTSQPRSYRALWEKKGANSTLDPRMNAL